jgi:cytochrome b involved in lipid metabolism
MNELKKYLPKKYYKRKYYNVSELALHNKPNDMWIAFFHEIYDLTKLVQQNTHHT